MHSEIVDLLQVFGENALPSRAVRAMRNGSATEATVLEYLRNGTGKPGGWAGWLPQWRQTVTAWQAGTLFIGQKKGWEAWRCDLYSRDERWQDRRAYEEKVWTPAFCCGETGSEAYHQIFSFYCLRVDERYHHCSPKALDSMDEFNLDKVKHFWHLAESKNGWNCWGHI